MRDLIAIKERSPQERLIIAKTLIESVLDELPSAQPDKYEYQGKLEAAYDDGFNHGYMQARFDYEPQWIPCSEPSENEENVFIAHGTKDFMACCIGHYDHDSGLWYEDRNWFARPIYDGMYWCEMPMLPETEG